jgi:RHS repeat-associated protein
VTASFVYDGLGRREKKSVNGNLTEFLYDGLNPVQETSGAAVVANILPGLGIDEHLARADVPSATTRYFLPDVLGSAIALTDSAGAVQTDYTYEPFGRTVATGASNSSSYQYTGRENDSTGLYYHRSRYYHPILQRFVIEDPIDFSGGNVNFYVYVENNPLNLVDPLGLYSMDEFVNDAANASAGFGDTISFGFSNWVRDKLGTNSAVNTCSSAYNAGEWAGVAYGVAAGGAAGWRAAGHKAAGKEFSHWIPSRMGGPRSNWNGNYVTPQRHYYHDPYRYPPGWRDLGPRLPGPARQFDRIPNTYKGAGAGGGAAAASAAGSSRKC